jgi:hypothetical protein
MGLRRYGDCSAFLELLQLSTGPCAGCTPAFSFPGPLAGEFDLGDGYLFPDAAFTGDGARPLSPDAAFTGDGARPFSPDEAFTGDGARPLSLAGTDTIFPGCCRAAPELANAGTISARRPGERLTLRLPLPPPVRPSWLAERFRSGVRRRGEGLDDAAAPSLPQSQSSSAPPRLLSWSKS